MMYDLENMSFCNHRSLSIADFILNHQLLIFSAILYIAELYYLHSLPFRQRSMLMSLYLEELRMMVPQDMYMMHYNQYLYSFSCN